MTLPEHLQAILQPLIATTPQPLAIECRYACRIGGHDVSTPVALVPRHDYTPGSAEPLLAEAITQWYSTARPPAVEGRFVLAIDLFDGQPPRERTVRAEEVSW